MVWDKLCHNKYTIIFNMKKGNSQIQQLISKIEQTLSETGTGDSNLVLIYN